MKSLYIGYFKPSEADIKEMWQNSIFVFDTNVLLHLYRYSTDAREQLLNIIEAFKDRTWIPRKVADEFFDNRLEVLGKQIQEYSNLTKILNKAEDDLKNSRQHPFINSDSLQKFQELLAQIKSELDENKNLLLARSNDDEILNRIGELFDGKVGDSFSQAELDAIYTEGAQRAEKKIPPGFRDVQGKANSGDNYRIYGDFVLWKQILEKASKEQCGVIFVSDDKKEDWWLEFQGRKISPLPYLSQEFHEKTKKPFFMYTVDRFMEYASKFLETAVSEAIIEEVRDIRETEERKYFTVISEQTLLEKLKAYESLISDDPQAYVGLRHFVTVVLGEQGYEINHSYAIINNLIEREVIKSFEVPTGLGMAKAISLKQT
ncbi:MAG: PIN domain-containing protein [Acidobacteriota bacterium]|nr:PIN domain-containing protein [Acidobacteriota bacterium]